MQARIATLTLRDHFHAGWVPPRLAPPPFHAHGAQTDHWYGTIAIPKLDARAYLCCQAYIASHEENDPAHLRCGTLDSHFRVNPMLPRQREIQRRSIGRAG